ncbi:S41 family peptidase [Vibrio sp. WXL103]|uniref:S41 family peptidase n=1 Tax=Vibrio sp. WXL103 TaxID=3450710 RepID=UPI003EC7F1F1
MEIGKLSIGCVLTFLLTMFGCQSTQTHNQPQAKSSTLAEKASNDVGATLASSESKHEFNWAGTLVNRLHSLFYHRHLNQDLSQSEREENLFNSIVKMQIDGQCLFTLAEIESLRARSQSKMLTDAQKRRFDSGDWLFQQIDLRHSEQLTYKLDALSERQMHTVGIDIPLLDCWQQQLANDQSWLSRLEMSNEASNEYLVANYQSQLNKIEAQNQKSRAQRWASAYAKAFGKNDGYLPANHVVEQPKEHAGLGLLLVANDYGAEVIDTPFTTSPTNVVPGEIVIAIGDDQHNLTPMLNRPLEEVVTFLRGEAGSSLTLWLYSPLSDQIRVVEETRHQPARKPTLSFSLSTDQQVALVELSSMPVGVSDQFAEVIKQLRQRRVNTLVLDLRGNGGGTLEELTKLLGQFGLEGKAYALHQPSERSFQDIAVAETSFAGNVVVLVDHNTAGEAEMLTATMQDYHRAMVVGESTYGHGVVRQYRSLDRIYDLFEDKLGHVALTFATLHRIDGTPVDGLGVQPDVLIPQTLDQDASHDTAHSRKTHGASAFSEERQQLTKLYAGLSLSNHSVEETTQLAIDIARTLNKI